MNILFLGLGNHQSITERSISMDLLRVFIANGSNVYIVCPLGNKEHSERIIDEENSRILKVNTGKIQKTNIIQKGINTILLEKRFIKAIQRHYNDIRFDLILYPTPPITFLSVVEYIKKRDNARAYLMLKDIFPQNAVDIGMMSKSGIKGFAYRFFRKKEKKLYEVSDYIGCMSQANIDYLKRHNPEIDEKKIGLCPNSIQVEDKSVDKDARLAIRKKYGIPLDKKVFIYGGNLGKPQGIPFLISCLETVQNIQEAYFLIIGAGTEYGKLNSYVSSSKQNNVRLMKRLPRTDYDTLVGACDVGMIFLDHRFTIPNYPSRLLSYMQAKIPVLACTDINTDVGQDIVNGEFGWWCESNDKEGFRELVKKILKDDLQEKGNNGYSYLLDHFQAKDTYEIIINEISNNQ